MSSCTTCGRGAAIWPSPFGGALCEPCARMEISRLLNELEPEAWRKIRRRIEDQLRKSKADLRWVAKEMVLRERIKYHDVI